MNFKEFYQTIDQKENKYFPFPMTLQTKIKKSVRYQLFHSFVEMIYTGNLNIYSEKSYFPAMNELCHQLNNYDMRIAMKKIKQILPKVKDEFEMYKVKHDRNQLDNLGFHEKVKYVCGRMPKYEFQGEIFIVFDNKISLKRFDLKSMDIQISYEKPRLAIRYRLFSYLNFQL